MTLFDTAALNKETMHRLSPDTVSNVYNGLDCCVTFEVYERLMEELAEEPDNVRATYAFALEKSAPFLEMSLRGILIDQAALRKTQDALQKTLDEVKARFAYMTKEIFGHAISATSHIQVKWLFYEYLGISAIKKRNSKGVYAPSSDEDALNRLMFNFWAEPFARYILVIRELSKKLSFLRTKLSEEGRFRTSLNIAGTNTGRSSSSSSDFGDGSNLQNIDTTLRYPFVADEGMILVNVDLEQADARNVGATIYSMAIDSDEKLPDGRWVRDLAPQYLDACESGDTHSMVAKMSWPELDWPEDFKDWKDFCDNIDVYPGVSYRQAAKKLGHATNYLGQPRSIAERTHIPRAVVEAFQPRYFKGFPLIPWWQQETIRLIKETGTLTTLYGRRRHFYGRPDDAETWRAAIAYCPQSMTGEQIDRGITQLWKGVSEAQLLIQVHDSILFQVPYARHVELVPRALELLRFPIALRGGRMFEVPLEAKTGYNWGNRLEDKKTGKVENEWGLSKWKGQDPRTPPNRKRSVRELIG